MPDDSAPAPARATTAEGHQPNHLLRARRKATPSPTLASEPMSRAELADAVNHHLWHTTGKVHAMNAHTIARYERGAIRWPTTPYRHALRAVLHAASDTELGFRPHRTPPPSRREADTVGDIARRDQPVHALDTTPQTYLGLMLCDRPALRIGTRRSPMAMAQARMVQDLIARHTDTPTDIVGIETSGDQWMGDLAELGGKGAFLKEIDRHLLMNRIDLAVHAMKDVPGDQPAPEGTLWAAYLPREDVRDVLVTREGSKYRSLEEMPPGTRIGTSAVRRKAQLLKHRPDLHVDRIRGNVNTRIARLDSEERFEAIILNLSGLHRVRMEHRATQVIDPEVMCPAVGSGVIGVQCRTADTAVAELLRLIDDPPTRTWTTAERTMLTGLHGHCNSPIAGHCSTTADGQLSLIGMVFTREGGQFAYAHEWDTPHRPEALGAIVAATLLRKGARGIIDGISH